MTLRNVIFSAVLVALAACTTRQDALNATPMLDRVFDGDYLAIGACTLHGIQTGDYTIFPSVQYIPVPSEGYVEIQTTASSGLTGTMFGALTRLDDIDGSSFRGVVRAPYTADGDVAIEALMSCVSRTE